MAINPDFFTLFFYIVIFLIGIDFSISGILLLKAHTMAIEKPRLLGLLSLKINRNMIDKMQNSNHVYQSLYSFKYIRIYILVAGFLIIIGSLIGIIDLFYRLL